MDQAKENLAEAERMYRLAGDSIAMIESHGRHVYNVSTKSTEPTHSPALRLVRRRSE